MKQRGHTGCVQLMLHASNIQRHDKKKHEDATGIIRIRKSDKDRQKKKYKSTNNDLQNIKHIIVRSFVFLFLVMNLI